MKMKMKCVACVAVGLMLSGAAMAEKIEMTGSNYNFPDGNYVGDGPYTLGGTYFGYGTGNTGSLLVQDGGEVSMSSSWSIALGYSENTTGNLTVTGTDSTTGTASTFNANNTIFSGDATGATGNMIIENGGTMNASDTVYVGGANSSATENVNGTMIVRGVGTSFVGSVWSSINMGRGASGSASLLVEDGASVTTQNMTINVTGVDSVATVRGSGTTLSVGDDLTIGDSKGGEATLRVDQGAQMDVAGKLLMTGTSAEVIIDGGGSVLSTYEISTSKDIRLQDGGILAVLESTPTFSGNFYFADGSIAINDATYDYDDFVADGGG